MYTVTENPRALPDHNRYGIVAPDGNVISWWATHEAATRYAARLNA